LAQGCEAAAHGPFAALFVVFAVARVDGQTVSVATREAVEKHLATRSSDPEFQKRVKKKIEEDIATAKRLAARLDDEDGSGIT
jgi:hypothetical protein